MSTVTSNAENAFRRSGPIEDQEAVLAVHNEWWDANLTLDVERMRRCFAHDMYYQFNLTGHPYYSLDEKTELWRSLTGVVSIPKIGERYNLRLEVVGDVAWIACEVVIVTTQTQTAFPEQVEGRSAPIVKLDVAQRMRETEIYHRDDGLGNAEWRIWHHHASPCADDAEPRMPFGDTYASRQGA